MFETTTSDGVQMMVHVSFWQCMKAGLAFALGASLWLPVIVVLAGGTGLFWTALLGLLSLHH